MGYRRITPSSKKTTFIFQRLICPEGSLNRPPAATQRTPFHSWCGVNVHKYPKAISAYIIAQRGDNKSTEALISALRLVFRFNFLKFLGDTYWQQISGTVMGTPPAPAWAILYYALHENNLVQRWQQNLFFLYLFMILLAFGFQTQIQLKTINSGPTSVKIWMDAKALHGNVNLHTRRSILWT